MPLTKEQIKECLREANQLRKIANTTIIPEFSFLPNQWDNDTAKASIAKITANEYDDCISKLKAPQTPPVAETPAKQVATRRK